MSQKLIKKIQRANLSYPFEAYAHTIAEIVQHIAQAYELK